MASDAEQLHALILSHEREGHLLPRSLDDLRRRADRFVVCDVAGEIKAAAELAPLSSRLAEIRSLVVSSDLRGAGLATRLVTHLRDRAQALGFETLCALTHDARFFAHQNFSIVPHLWLPEKIAADCVSCPHFRSCGQFAMILPLRAMARSHVPTPPARQPAVAVA